MPLEIKKKTILRIHPNFFYTYNKESEIYKKYISYFVENKDYKIVSQKKDYITNIHDSKLVYFNSESTGILETLAIWRDDKDINDPYIVKLYSEFDKLIVIREKMLAKFKKPKIMEIV